MYTKEVAIAGIVILEAIALYQGIDGAALSLVIAALAGLGGYELRTIMERKKDG